MAYLALYREWRPKKFDEIVGQEHVKITLSNALRQNRVAHAYLFSGPRGTGKTTAAKILAKALNCTNRADTDAEPCNQCDSCLGIDQGQALDVMEIDAASNRGIDEIRDLRDKVRLSSSGGKYKVYIIDEVHMLTTEAFNALLKTLEEPPASVIFVLATTEAHKVPLTILSRVQRFEFHRISTKHITRRLKEVCTKLERKVDENALQVIAAKAEGGLRDALSILDQCLIIEEDIAVEHVYRVLGMVGETFSADLVDMLLGDDYGRALQKLDEGVSLGRDPRQIIRELLDYLRQGLLYAAGGQKPLLSSELNARVIDQSKKAGINRILAWINSLLKGEAELRYASNSRLAAEMIIVQTMYDASLTADRTPMERMAGSTSEKKVPAEKPRTKTSARIKEIDPVSAIAVKEGESLSLNLIKQKWPEVLEKVKKQKKSTHAFLLEGKPVKIEGGNLFLAFRDGYSFHKDKFNQPENKDYVEEVLNSIFGESLILNSVMESELPVNDIDADQVQTENTAKKKVIEDQEAYVQKAKEFFGTDLVVVKR